MKLNIALALICLAGMLSVYSCSIPANAELEKPNIKKAIDQFEEFWETEDMALLSKIIAHDSNMINIGSDAGEYFIGWEGLKSSIEQMLPVLDSIQIEVKNQIIQVHTTGNVAWFSEIWSWNFVYSGQRVMMENQRLTGVLEKRDGQWVIVQFHNSVPVLPS
jgi:uncharacterized protein (TIGR02246 family)